MRKIIREVALREGKRSQTSIANVRETIAVLMDVLAESFVMTTDGILAKEFEAAMNKKIEKLAKKKGKTKK